MKLGICSDIHLEFGYLPIDNKEGIDVLVLAGDILVAKTLTSEGTPHKKTAEQFRTFFSECSAKFPHVVFIMGNHEHYHGDFNETAKTLRKFCASIGSNIHFLDKEAKQIDDVIFIGQTL